MTTNEIFAALGEPFDASDMHEGRPTVRALMNRLDEAVGQGMWQDEYLEIRSGRGVACTILLTIERDEGTLEVKHGAVAGYGDGEPGAILELACDEAFRRAAAKHGLARGDYREARVIHANPEARPASSPAPKAPPASAPPPPSAPRREAPPASDEASGEAGGPVLDDEGKEIPTNDPRRFLGWLSGYEKKYKTDLFRTLAGWGKDQGYGGSIKAWDADQLRDGAIEALRLCSKLPKPKGSNAAAHPPPPEGNGRPAPSSSSSADSFKPDMGDPLLKVKKIICSTARQEYFARQEEPPSDGEMRDFLNGILEEFDYSPRFELPGGIHAYDNEQWLDWVASKLQKMVAERNEGMLVNGEAR